MTGYEMGHLEVPQQHQHTAPPHPRSGSHSPWDSVEDLPEPVLPWMKTESRQSFGGSSRNSVDSNSLHVIKRYAPDPTAKKRQLWTARKWWILLANTLLFCYGLAILLFAILTFLKFYQSADVVIVGERKILNLIIATGAICLASSLLGYVGIMLNNRAVLTFYNLLLWVCFGLIASIGYVAYRKAKWNIQGKLSYQWHYDLTPDGRARLQANLHCCGYKSFTDFHERSNKCFPRTLLPGCRYKYQQFTIQMLRYTWIVAFSLVPGHLFVVITALLCSNHVNRKFGKNLPPKIYRLDYQGIIAGTPTGSSVNLHNDGLQHRSST
ncbi:tetraspanin tsp2 [Lichtheimia corymbifera JMRC:FSU:9682]|uniref:Tetraspanin tsp2 n=1 Tax=Lichtheimia corymbifera JMRC:FSU:9682 TaxID=1263082 RepID=A0A068RPR8_9FUNG|nr:tetraspanin tsp2 [Lichtheimia corymbifera JMRC:FSU:9682]